MSKSILAFAFVTAISGAFAGLAQGADEISAPASGIVPSVDSHGHDLATDAAGEVGNGVTWILQQEREREQLERAGFPQYND